ncbi:DUF826 domain-containing protein [Escherichia coli]|uniref:DUF826 domain-containing protein n=1 Tax=Escherichia coli TaxID=562 RepID=UPI003CC90E33
MKEVLRSEEVLSALKQKLRHNLEARLDAEVDAILMNCWAHWQLRSRKASRVRSASDSGEPTPDSDMMM